MMARKVMGALVAGAMGATPVLADVYANNVVQQLESEGFRSISTERTWLGRMRIVAESGDGQREIIINPNNGEVLRDLWLVERRDGGDLAGSGGNEDGGGQVAASTSGQADDNGGKLGDGKTSRSDDSNDDKEDRKQQDNGGDRSSSKSGDDGGRAGDDNGGRSDDD